MTTLKRKLPGLNGIITFEAAARHLSFTRAAAELCVSQAAVSRQIRRLEEHLGTALFTRGHRSLRLTDGGRRLHQAVTMGLEHIASVASEVSQPRESARIQVATTVALATFWLMPRLNAFRQSHPDVDVRVVASDRREDHFAEEVDVVLACGERHPPGREIYFLFSERIFPVCAPDYLQGRRLGGPAALPGERLLHLDHRHWDDIGWEPIDWTVWLGHFGLRYQPAHPILTFNNYPMLVQAALEGEGIALGWQHLVEHLIEAGRLVRPVGGSLDSGRGYYLVVGADAPARPEVGALRDWILASRPRESRPG